jgi:hypothetical protein
MTRRLFLLLTLVATTGAFAETAKPFRAGAATSNITPPLGYSINGNMADHPATNVHDELHARALVLDDGTTKLAIVVNDSCMIPRPVLDEAKKLAEERTGIPAQNMLCSATHAHSCGTAAAVFQSVPDPEYLHFLSRRIADAIARADNNLAPAKIGWGAGSVPGDVFNRRWYMKDGTMPANPFGVKTEQVKMNPGPANPNLVKPAGPTDPAVPVVAVQTPEGKPIAVLANYSLHYVGGVGPGDISADYYGAFADRLQDLLKADRQDPPFVAIMSNGTSGNINNVNFREKRAPQKPYEQIRKVADDTAQEVARVYRNLEFRPTAKLAARTRDLTLGVRKPTPEEVTRAKEILAKAKDPKKLAGLEEIYAGETMAMKDYPDQVSIPLQALRIGDLGITAIPCEVFVEIGLQLKKESALQPMFNIELANGYNGYLPTPEQHELGGYETWRAKSAYLAADSSPKIVTQLLEMLRELKGQ